MEDICAEFTFREIEFKIEADPWEQGLWVETKDGQKHISELDEIKNHIQKRSASQKLSPRNVRR